MVEAKCDILIIGAGPAGIAAALAASQGCGAVIVIDQGRALGGRSPEFVERHLKALTNSGVDIKHNTNLVAFLSVQRALCDSDELADALVINYKSIILATGARELMLPFPGWTLPGVFGAGGLSSLAAKGLSVQGGDVVIAGSGPLLLAAARDLQNLGARVVAIVEQVSRRRLGGLLPQLLANPNKLIDSLRLLWATRNIPKLYSSWVESAEPNKGCDRPALNISVRHEGGNIKTLEATLLGCSYGLVAEMGAAQLLGCEVLESPGKVMTAGVLVNNRQETNVSGVYSAGAVCQIGGRDSAWAMGRVAGLAAAGIDEGLSPAMKVRDRCQKFTTALARVFALRGEVKKLALPGTIVCRCESVSFEAIAPYTNSREAKLMTRCGMGSCQGRICGSALNEIYAAGWRHKARAPLTPTALQKSIFAKDMQV